jgi:hypothetical protein
MLAHRVAFVQATAFARKVRTQRPPPPPPRLFPASSEAALFPKSAAPR